MTERNQRKGVRVRARGRITDADLDYAGMVKTCVRCGRRATKGYVRADDGYVCRAVGCGK